VTAATLAPTIPVLENIVVGLVPATGYSVTLEPIQKRVRAFVSGVAVVDSIRVVMMRETAHLGVYYFPLEDVRADLLVPSGTLVASPYKGDASYFSVEVGGRVVADAAWRYLNPPPDCPDLSGYVAFHWRAVDAWYEEDEEVFVHARDPLHRIDVLDSSRHVRVVIGGRTVADTRRGVFLFETSLPTRYYIPKLDVHFEHLRPSPMRTACAYKGRTTAYWSAETADGSVRDVAWSYEVPRPEAAKVANMVAFFNERVDAIFVDGVEMPRSQTMWS
jgi:uncharacterized protein (DUF427 family)